MLAEVLDWGLRPAFTTGDSWYACEKNLKTVKNHRMGLMFAVEANRTVSVEKGTWVQVQKLDVPDEGLMVWLRNVGQVKLFRTRLKDQLRHYVVCLPDAQGYSTFGRLDFQKLHDQHWGIEIYQSYNLRNTQMANSSMAFADAAFRRDRSRARSWGVA